MSVLAMVVVFLVGGMLQALLPTFALLGHAPVPVLTALVVYYALTRRRTTVLWAAMLAGVVQDALGPVPLGYSSCGFCLAGLLLNRYRDEVFIWAGVTHLVFGALAAAGATLLQALLLAGGAGLHLAPGHVALKLLGATVLGAVSTPLVYAAVESLETTLGIMSPRRV